MKFLIKSSIIIMFLLGFYLCTSFNFFSESLYSLIFYRENFLNHMYNILLQNKELYNTVESEGSIHEYYISILNPFNIEGDLKNIIGSSSFNILNAKGVNPSYDIQNMFPYTSSENSLIMNIGANSSLSKDKYKFYKYDDYSISYMNPILKTNEDRFKLHKCLEIAEGISCVSPIFINKEELNKKLIPSLVNSKRIFIILGDETNIYECKKRPIISLNTLNDNGISYLYQINLILSNGEINKIRLKIYPIRSDGTPIYGEGLFEILNTINNNSKIKFQIHENDDYILNEYDILRDS